MSKKSTKKDNREDGSRQPVPGGATRGRIGQLTDLSSDVVEDSAPDCLDPDFLPAVMASQDDLPSDQTEYQASRISEQVQPNQRRMQNAQYQRGTNLT